MKWLNQWSEPKRAKLMVCCLSPVNHSATSQSWVSPRLYMRKRASFLRVCYAALSCMSSSWQLHVFWRKHVSFHPPWLIAVVWWVMKMRKKTNGLSKNPPHIHSILQNNYSSKTYLVSDVTLALDWSYKFVIFWPKFYFKSLNIHEKLHVHDKYTTRRAFGEQRPPPRPDDSDPLQNVMGPSLAYTTPFHRVS